MTFESVLDLCIHGTEDRELAGRLEGIKAELLATGRSYNACAKVQSLHSITRVQSVGAVLKHELKALYVDHLSATRGSARAVYDAIRNAAPNKKCPLCGIGTVAVVDHHLPQSQYPDLAVLPSNLIPACHFCNDRKKARYPRTAEEQTLHPYFDSHLTDRWIFASLLRSPRPVLVFEVQPPHHWSEVDKKRAHRHFFVCDLGTALASNANDEMITLRDRLEPLYCAGGDNAVRDYLTEEAKSHQSRLNSWQYSMYNTLQADRWFVDGGFDDIER